MVLHKKGVSTIITTLLLVSLAFVGVIIISKVVIDLVKEETENSESCLRVFEKISLSREFTCYDSANEKVRFLINMGNITIDELIVSITNDSESNIFTITNDEESIAGLKNNDGTPNIKLPSINSGKAYLAEGFTTTPSSIRISPRINGNLCEVVDSITNIRDCPI